MNPELPKSSDIISDSLIRNIQERLSQGKPVRRTLPLNGRLHIDRTLPFLIVYRRPHRRPDAGTERLVKGEASYLIVSNNPKLKSSLSQLIRIIVRTLGEGNGAFLIVEIWSGVANRVSGEIGLLTKPGFRIFTSSIRPPTKTVETLEKALKRIRILKKSAEVGVFYDSKRSPVGSPPLLSTAEARKLNCYVVGLKIEPIYRNPITGDVYPLVLRMLHRGLAHAIKRAVFEFCHSQTTLRPPNYQALGRRAVVKAVWEIDRQLAEISQSFDFLLQVTPINIDKAWRKFRNSRFEKTPVLYYRPLPVDPPLLKRKLYQIRIGRVEDPSLAFLFREKQKELDRELSMLMDRGKREFLYGSLQLFGGIGDKLKEEAWRILTTLSPRSRDESSRNALTAGEFAERAQYELDFYRNIHSGVTGKVLVRNDTVGLMVSRGNLLIGKQTRIPKSRVEALIQHEIGTHVLTYFNGRAQPFRQLYCGLAGYEALQEGLAVLAEFLVGGLSRPRLRLLAGRVMAALHLIEGASFIDTFRKLNRVYGFEQHTAFTITVRIYRGGGLTKDAVYLRGLTELLHYLKNGGELDPLFVGKIGTDHVAVVKELQFRQVLHDPILRPRYLQHPLIDVKLARLKNGLTPLELVERRKR